MRSIAIMVAMLALMAVAGPSPVVAQPRPAGATAAASDFNGDGYGDLAIGAPDESIGNVLSAGAVHIIYGSQDGLTGQASQLWHQDVAGVADTAEASDQFGWALAWGDFDGDGYADLAVGIPSEDIQGESNAGAVQVLRGSPAGLTTDGQVLIEQDALGSDQTESGDLFGWALAAADFGESAHADLAVGVPGENTHAVFDAGAVHTIYGSPDGLGIAGGDHLWSQAFPGVPGAPEEGDQFGSTLAAGDLGKTTHADLAVGVPYEALDDRVKAGVVHVFFGSDTGLTTTDDQLWSQDSPGIGGAPEDDDRFGAAIVAADFGKTGHADLAIGVPMETHHGVEFAGVVNVIYGSASGPTGAGSQVWDRANGGIQGEAEYAVLFGIALAAGDLGMSSRADLVVGAPGVHNAIDHRGPGTVSVIYGTADGLSPANDDYIEQIDLVPGSDQTFREDFGAALTAIDLGKSGRADLAIGVPAEGRRGIPAAGQVHVVYGGRMGLNADGNQVWHQASPGIPGVPENGDHFGATLSPGQPVLGI